jgi:hypothetical protein
MHLTLILVILLKTVCLSKLLFPDSLAEVTTLPASVGADAPTEAGQDTDYPECGGFRVSPQ